MSGWIRQIHPAPDDAPRLVCLPHAGGSASFFFPVSRALAPAVRVLAVQYPGRQDRRTDPNIDNIPELAEQVTAALAPHTDRPLAFFGHSMGAVLGYEVALRLQRAGKPLTRLYASGRRAPSRYRDESVHKLDDDGIIAELRLLSGTDTAILGDPEVLRMVMPAIRSDYTAIETYQHEPGQRLRCPLTVLTGDSDPKTSLEEAKAWADHTDGEFDLRVYPGDHFYLTRHSAALIALLREELTTP